MKLAFIDASGQVVATQVSPNAPSPTKWETDRGCTRVEVPAGVVATRDHKYVNGDFVASVNPVQPPPPSYDQLREAAYPNTGDQLDMQYHDSVDGTTTWADAIAAVKTKYPKDK